MSYTKYVAGGSDLVDLYGATSQTIGVGAGLYALDNGTFTGGDTVLTTLPNGDKYNYSTRRGVHLTRRKFGLFGEFFYSTITDVPDLAPSNGLSFITYNGTMWCLRGSWPNGSATLFRSTDGLSWTAIKTYTQIASNRQGIVSSKNYLIFPVHGNSIGLPSSGTVGQLISRDGGSSWALEMVSSTALMAEPAVVDFGGDLYWLLRHDASDQRQPLSTLWENGSTGPIPELGTVQRIGGSPPCLLSLSSLSAIASYCTANGSDTISFFTALSFGPRKAIHWHKLGEFYGEGTQVNDAYRYGSMLSIDSSHIKVVAAEPDSSSSGAQEFTILHTPITGARLTYPNSYPGTIYVPSGRSRISIKLWIRAIGSGTDTTLYLRDSSARIWGGFSFAGTPNNVINTIEAGGTISSGLNIRVDQGYLLTFVPNTATGAIDLWLNDRKVRAGTRSNSNATVPTALNWDILDDGTVIDLEELVIEEVGSETP